MDFEYDDINHRMLYRGEDMISPELLQDMMAAEYRGGKEYLEFIESELEPKYQRLFGWKIREKKIDEILG